MIKKECLFKPIYFSAVILKSGNALSLTNVSVKVKCVMVTKTALT